MDSEVFGDDLNRPDGIDEVARIGERGDRPSILLVIVIALALVVTVALAWVGFGIGEKVAGWFGGDNSGQVLEGRAPANEEPLSNDGANPHSDVD